MANLFRICFNIILTFIGFYKYLVQENDGKMAGATNVFYTSKLLKKAEHI
jgi:hypothetical protein